MCFELILLVLLAMSTIHRQLQLQHCNLISGDLIILTHKRSSQVFALAALFLLSRITWSSLLAPFQIFSFVQLG